MIAQQFAAWQACGHVHPLTCVHSDHGPLEAKAEGPTALVVECPVCHWSQTIAKGSVLYQILCQFNPAGPFYTPTDGGSGR